MKNFNKNLIVRTVSGVLLTGSTALMAAVPVGIDTAITTASTDAATVAGYVIIALAGLVALRWMTKLVRGA